MEKAQIYGKLVDKESRCEHWHGPLDVIALRFKCCNRYYACYECHQELVPHVTERYNINDETVPLVICGVCKLEMSFAAYGDSLQCPNCRSQFNPGCKLHYDMYFMKDDEPENLR